MNRPLKDSVYYLTLFTIEGHQTYRTHISEFAHGFEQDQKKGVMAAKVTDSKVYRIDRLTGNITPL